MSAPCAIFHFILLTKSSVLLNVTDQNTWQKKVHLRGARCNSAQLRLTRQNLAQLNVSNAHLLFFCGGAIDRQLFGMILRCISCILGMAWNKGQFPPTPPST